MADIDVYSQLKEIFEGIRDERRMASNTATRIGNAFLALLEYAKSVDKPISGDADTAAKLQTARSIWGQMFDGTADVMGDMTGVGTITPSSGDLKIVGNLLVTGGITMYATDGVSSGIMDAILVDNDTIGINDKGQLYVIKAGGGGTVTSIVFGGNKYSPVDGVITLPVPTYTFANIQNKPTSISGYGIADAYTKTEVDDILKNLTTASKLQTARSIWGQMFDGTADVMGDMTGVGTITPSSGDLKIVGNLLVTGGITMYATDGVSSGIMDAILVDNDTIGINDKGQLYVIKAGGGGTVTSIVFGGNKYSPVDGVITLPVPTYTFANIQNKPTSISGYGITDAYTKTEVDNLLNSHNAASATKLKTARSIWGQMFDGAADVTGDMTNVGTITPSSGDLKIVGNLLVTGGITMYATDGVSSGIMDAILVDNDTIGINNKGQLCVIKAIGGGTVTSIVFGGNKYSPVDGVITLPLPIYSFSDLSWHPTTLAGYGITDAKIVDGVITLGANSITPLTSHQSLANYYTKSDADSSFVNVSGDTMTGALKVYNLRLEYANEFNSDSTLFIGYRDTPGGVVLCHNDSPLVYGSGAYRVWHQGNDGSGSGLDADLLDGYHASSFSLTSHTHNSILDVNNSTVTAFAYSKGGLSYGDITWLGGWVWNGSVLELRAIARDQFLSTAVASSTYVKKSGDTMSGNLHVGYVNDSFSGEISASQFMTNGWFRSMGGTGWYNESYGGGWYMIDSTWIRNYANKNLYMGSATMRTDGELQVGGDGSTLRVINGGNVGIGTTSPSAKFQVNGIIAGYNYTNNHNAAAFVFDKPGSYITGIGCNGENDTIQFGACGWDGVWVDYKQKWKFNGDILVNGDIVFNTNTLMRYQASTTPAGFTMPNNDCDLLICSRLPGGGDEGGIVVGSDCCVVYNSADEGAVFKVIDKDANPDLSQSYTGSSCYLWVGQDGWCRAKYLYASGDILAGGSITMYSDLRKKNVISDEVLSVKEIAQAPLFKHTYKSDTNNYWHIGTSAQYWAARHNNWFTRLDNEGYYQMELQNLGVAMGISLAREIVKYESKTDKKIRIMKKKINDLEARIKELEGSREERRTA